MQEPAGREAVAQAPDELVGERPLGRADRSGVPLFRLEIVDRDKGRFAAHGEPHVVGDKRRVDVLAELVERLPGLLGEGLGDARMLRHAPDPHVEGELDIGEAREPRDRRGVAIMRRCGERNVALAGQQPGGRIEADPARARKIDLDPGVQIGEVVVGAGRPVERDEVGLQLDEIAGDESRRKAQVAQDLHQEPARIAAGAEGAPERLLRALHARLHADDILDLVRQATVEVDHEIDGALRRPVDSIEKRLQVRTRRLGRTVDDEVGPQILAIFERPDLSAFLDEEVERIIDRHVGDDVDLDLQFVDQLREDVARQPVAVGILLDVDEMLGGRDFQRMRDYARPALRRRPEPDDLRAQRDRPVVFIVRQVMDCGLNGHRGAGRVFVTIEPFTVCCDAQSRAPSLPQLCWGRWREAPDGVWRAGMHR